MDDKNGFVIDIGLGMDPKEVKSVLKVTDVHRCGLTVSWLDARDHIPIE